jgi:hypothetical protein
MKLDSTRSKIAVYTFAEGLLSRLAHDLEIAANDASGEAQGDTCTLHIPVRALAVVGAVKRGQVDRGVLSASDRESIERQIQGEVLRGAEITARGTREGGTARIAVTAPTGRAEVTCPIDVSTSEREARARGEVELSLRALGIAPVKGPMGAFRLADRVRVTFELTFVAEASTPGA